MKKTLATLLVLAMVMSVCCAMFVSAGDPAAELKAELEALVGAKEGAAYDWNIDVSVDEAGIVTANVYLTGSDEEKAILVETYLYYDAEELTLLNGKSGDAIDCITAAPGEVGIWENFSSTFDGGIMLSALNLNQLDKVITDAEPLVFTLKFQLAEGVTLAGMYIPSNDECYIADGEMNAVYGNGAYAIVNTHTHEYVPAEVAEPNLSKEGAVTYTCECGASYTEPLPAVKAQPDELVALPEGALTLDYAGYIHDAFFCILAGDNLTVNELTALGNNGAGKDMNYCNVIVVDADGVVTETWFTLGRPDGVKSDVVCPEGGYIIGFNGNKAGADALTKIEKGAKITLYNIDLEAIRGVEGHAAVTNAGFTYENPAVDEPDVPVENTKVEINVNDNALLTDGNTGFTGGWGDVSGKVVLANNGNCTAAGMDVTLYYALGETKKIDGITVDLYHCADVMIGYPEGQATVLVSVDGETWTEVGKFDLAAAEVALGKPGTVSNVFEFDAVEAAYVKVLLYAGSSTGVLGDTPADNKIFWEFISVAEVAVSEAPVEQPPVDPEKPKHYEDTLVKGENGNYTVDYPYGFTWDVDYKNGTLQGEDVTICDSLDAYNNSNPKYAISLILEKQADGSYLAVQDAIVGKGSVPAITLGEGQIVLVVHSSASNPDNEAYDNWLGKVVAMSVKTGDKFFVDTEAMTVTAVDPEAEVEPPVVEPSEPGDDSSEPDDGPGDAGVLLFAVLGILALAGAAVVIKVRN
ncbi:MAG: discoidin domain-containing protein [Clostridia bacterium]|nr:discoidin domain-containing protein [Clostridia bacterium]